MARNRKCPHLENVQQLSLSELCKAMQGKPCSKCDTYGPNLWICLYNNCLQTGCSEQYNDHSTEHFTLNDKHSVHMNLSSQRMWCYICEIEVFLTTTRRTSLMSNESSDTNRQATRIAVFDRIAGSDSCDSSGEDDDSDRQNHISGLIGLQNIANTCYMNAALQALSNTPPLTGYLLNCGDIIEAATDPTYLTCPRKAGLARSYHRLVREIWCRNQRNNGYLVPSGILNGIRSVHPMFRGYQQHDTQEFLRCFMDQLHEELKEVTPPPPSPPDGGIKNDIGDNDDNRSECSLSSQSEVEYETCDSNISEESSLSEDVPTYMKFRQNRFSRSPSPSNPINQSLKLNQTPLGTSFSNSTANSSSSTVKTLKNDNLIKSPHRSIISDIFDGKLLSSVQCLTCNRISTRTETFQDLSLPIPSKDHLTVLHQSQHTNTQQQQQQQQQQHGGVTCTDAVYQAAQVGWFAWLTNWIRSLLWGPAVSLYDCMAAFFSADELKGDNMYSCEKCNKLRNGIKFSRVLELPEMLCVHLKRFRHDLSYSSKITSPVNFPLRGLDMSSYLHKDCKSNVSTYDLTAIICHHGTVGGGHYTCFARHQLSGKWYEYDDQLVTEIAEEVVQNCEAYVLFYRKSNMHISQIREEAQQVELRTEHTAADISFYISKQWLNKFNTFAEPGPIDNWALLCPHGALAPSKAKIKSQLLVALPQPLWDFLYQKFGGGPALNHLYECDVCLRAAELLARRQAYELEEFQTHRDEMSTIIYAISMSWLRQWQLFIGGGTSDEPGPINNTSILSQNENGHRLVKAGSDYAQITASLWKFFYGIYGGGPEILLRGAPPIEECREPKHKHEIDALSLEAEQIISENSLNRSKYTEEIDQLKENEKSFDIEQNQVQIEKKVTKNVSFENDDSYYDKENSLINHDQESRRSKQQPQQQPNVKSSNIVSKRDKKQHGDITANGLFGPDGIYSDYSQYNSIPQEDLVPTHQQLQSNNTNSTPNEQNLNNMDNGASHLLNDYNDLVRQRVSKLANSSDVLHLKVITNPNKESNSRKWSHAKNTYRKKIKTKSSGKHNYNTNEVNLSDSDKN